MSRLFNFSLELLSTDAAVAYDKIIGQRVLIRIFCDQKKERFINGFVSRFSQTGRDHRFSFYQMEVVPWLWFLTRTADCRIFQKKSVPEIIQQIFKDLGFTDFKLSLSGNFPKREYCVQYRETDFNFVSRLMEEEGIFYFFEHDDKKHQLVLGNSPSVHKPCPHMPKARIMELSGGMQREDVITALQVSQELRPGKYALTDYNFETPSTSLLVNVPSTVKVGGNDRFEIYDFPGSYLQKGEGDRLVHLRMEEEESVHFVLTGASNCRGFIPGFSFDLLEHYRREWNKPYVLTEVQLQASAGDAYETEGNTSPVGEAYSNYFTCIPKSVVFRPRRITPKPVILGVQTAVVTGPAGEEIWVDKYGRIKVQFHWDREGKKDENTTCWIRVSQPWAGKTWGTVFLPRIGQEVIVQFLEGDPDQPIIVGRVHNAELMPPYELPANQTVSGILSRSSKGGATKTANELYFEDKKGVELIRLHAEKDLDISVENITKEFVNKDRHLIVGNDQFEEVGANLHMKTGKDKTEEVGSNSHLTVGQDLVEDIGGKHEWNVATDSVQKFGKNLHITAGMDQHNKAGKSFAVEAGMEVHIKAGVKLVLEGGALVTLKGPGGFVSINPIGVFIQGNMVFINSGGAATPGGGSSPGSPGKPGKPTKPQESSHGSSGMEDK
jgi:type VI secretion system secreted protein VgrG